MVEAFVVARARVGKVCKLCLQLEAVAFPLQVPSEKKRSRPVNDLSHSVFMLAIALGVHAGFASLEVP